MSLNLHEKGKSACQAGPVQEQCIPKEGASPVMKEVRVEEACDEIDQKDPIAPILRDLRGGLSSAGKLHGTASLAQEPHSEMKVMIKNEEEAIALIQPIIPGDDSLRQIVVKIEDHHDQGADLSIPDSQTLRSHLHLSEAQQQPEQAVDKTEEDCSDQPPEYQQLCEDGKQGVHIIREAIQIGAAEEAPPGQQSEQQQSFGEGRDISHRHETESSTSDEGDVKASCIYVTEILKPQCEQVEDEDSGLNEQVLPVIGRRPSVSVSPEPSVLNRSQADHPYSVISPLSFIQSQVQSTPLSTAPPIVPTQPQVMIQPMATVYQSLAPLQSPASNQLVSSTTRVVSSLPKSSRPLNYSQPLSSTETVTDGKSSACTQFFVIKRSLKPQVCQTHAVAKQQFVNAQPSVQILSSTSCQHSAPSRPPAPSPPSVTNEPPAPSRTCVPPSLIASTQCETIKLPAPTQPTVSIQPSNSIQPSTTIKLSAPTLPTVYILPCSSIQPSTTNKFYAASRPTVSIKPHGAIQPSTTNKLSAPTQPTLSIQSSCSIQPSTTIKLPAPTQPTASMQLAANVKPTVLGGPLYLITPLSSTHCSGSIQPSTTVKYSASAQPTVSIQPPVSNRPTVISQPSSSTTVCIWPFSSSQPPTKPTVPTRPTISFQPPGSINPSTTSKLSASKQPTGSIHPSATTTVCIQPFGSSPPSTKPTALTQPTVSFQPPGSINPSTASKLSASMQPAGSIHPLTTTTVCIPPFGSSQPSTEPTVPTQPTVSFQPPGSIHLSTASKLSASKQTAGSIHPSATTTVCMRPFCSSQPSTKATVPSQPTVSFQPPGSINPSTASKLSASMQPAGSIHSLTTTTVCIPPFGSSQPSTEPTVPTQPTVSFQPPGSIHHSTASKLSASKQTAGSIHPSATTTLCMRLFCSSQPSTKPTVPTQPTVSFQPPGSIHPSTASKLSSSKQPAGSIHPSATTTVCIQPFGSGQPSTKPTVPSQPTVPTQPTVSFQPPGSIHLSTGSKLSSSKQPPVSIRSSATKATTVSSRRSESTHPSTTVKVLTIRPKSITDKTLRKLAVKDHKIWAHIEPISSQVGCTDKGKNVPNMFNNIDVDSRREDYPKMAPCNNGIVTTEKVIATTRKVVYPKKVTIPDARADSLKEGMGPVWFKDCLLNQMANDEISRVVKPIQIKKNDSSYIGVFALRSLPKWTHFGPLQGKLVEDKPDTLMTWPITREGKTMYIDCKNYGNWMGLVRPALAGEENLKAVCLQGEIYFVVLRAIAKWEELKVWYWRSLKDSLLPDDVDDSLDQSDRPEGTNVGYRPVLSETEVDVKKGVQASKSAETSRNQNSSDMREEMNYHSDNRGGTETEPYEWIWDQPTKTWSPLKVSHMLNSLSGSNVQGPDREPSRRKPIGPIWNTRTNSWTNKFTVGWRDTLRAYTCWLCFKNFPSPRTFCRHLLCQHPNEDIELCHVLKNTPCSNSKTFKTLLDYITRENSSSPEQTDGKSSESEQVSTPENITKQSDVQLSCMEVHNGPVDKESNNPSFTNQVEAIETETREACTLVSANRTVPKQSQDTLPGKEVHNDNLTVDKYSNDQLSTGQDEACQSKTREENTLVSANQSVAKQSCDPRPAMDAHNEHPVLDKESKGSNNLSSFCQDKAFETETSVENTLVSASGTFTEQLHDILSSRDARAQTPSELDQYEHEGVIHHRVDCDESLLLETETLFPLLSKVCLISLLCPYCKTTVNYMSLDPCHRCEMAYTYKLCDACGLFFTRSLFPTHFRSKHVMAMCDACGKYESLATINKHMRLGCKWNKPSKTHTCHKCGKSFPNAYTLRKHSYVHMTDLPYKCEFCGRSFTQATNMKYHLRQHTGEQPYKCDKCPRTFTHNVSRKTHLKKVHGIDLWKQGQTGGGRPKKERGEPAVVVVARLTSAVKKKKAMRKSGKIADDTEANITEKEDGGLRPRGKRTHLIGEDDRDVIDQDDNYAQDKNKRLKEKTSKEDNHAGSEMDACQRSKGRRKRGTRWTPFDEDYEPSKGKRSQRELGSMSSQNEEHRVVRGVTRSGRKIKAICRD